MLRGGQKQFFCSLGETMSRCSLFTLIIWVALFGLNGCRRSNIAALATNTATPGNSRAAESTPVSTDNGSTKEPKASVIISSIVAYGLWWSDEQLANNFDADNPPPKKTYLRLDKWDASQPDSPHPDRIDIICQLENHTNGSVDLYLQAFADFKVASYEAIARGSGDQNAVDNKLKQVPWSDNRKLGKAVIASLLPGAAREVQFKDFDLSAVTHKYLKPAAGDLWPWKLRVVLVATSSDGRRIASSEAIINLVPAD